MASVVLRTVRDRVILYSGFLLHEEQLLNSQTLIYIINWYSTEYYCRELKFHIYVVEEVMKESTALFLFFVIIWECKSVRNLGRGNHTLFKFIVRREVITKCIQICIAKPIKKFFWIVIIIR